MYRFFSVVAAVALCVPWHAAAADAPGEVTPDVRSALARISAQSLRGHVSFLASDELEGRGTPSRGLDIAAEYIAAQFRRAGLDAPVDGGYFQTAAFVALEPNPEGLQFQTSAGIVVDPSNISVDSVAALSLNETSAVRFGDGAIFEGKVVVFHASNFRAFRSVRRQIMEGKPSLIVVTGPGVAGMRARPTLVPADQRSKDIPTISVRDARFAEAVSSAAPGELPFKLTIHASAPKERQVTLRNVVGVLRGSDPVLTDTYELVTAHYDHLGTRAEGTDKIFNGANDDASGTASVIEIASALAGLQTPPRRSIIFMAVFGEELGLLGSRYYGAHPLFPIARTIAGINLEQLGRTDSNAGTHAGMVNFTGFDFSNIPAVFRTAGDATGIRVVKDEANSDAFFGRSDNQALADLGVPSHTASVTYEFPDYHQVGDEWPKIDYDNMAKVDRAMALGVVMIANSAETPHWNPDEPKAARYLEAEKTRTTTTPSVRK